MPHALNEVTAADRQGMSVISAVNMVVQDSVFQRTRGTPPESGSNERRPLYSNTPTSTRTLSPADTTVFDVCWRCLVKLGVDFEPDYSGDRLSNITFVNVSTRENHGSGFSIWTGHLQGNGLPITMRFRDCSNTADAVSGLNIGAAKNPGLVEFDGHTVEGCGGPGVYLDTKNHDEFRVVIRDSVVRNASVPNARDSVYIDDAGNALPEAPIMFGCLSNTSRCGGVALNNVTVDDRFWNTSRNFLSVGWRGHPKSWFEHHMPIWNGSSLTHDIEGAGVVEFNGTMTVFTKVACCPSGRSTLVSDGEGGRICHGQGEICCLTPGQHGCPMLSDPKRGVPLCRHLPNFDRGGRCDTAGACAVGYGKNASGVRMEVQCNPIV
jgi:hypothetical protein